jgi:hypothetical protein
MAGSAAHYLQVTHSMTLWYMHVHSQKNRNFLRENFTKGLEFSSIIVLDITWVIDKKMEVDLLK